MYSVDNYISMPPPDIIATVLLLAVFALHGLTGSLLRPHDDQEQADDPVCHKSYSGRMEHLAMKTPYLPEPDEITIPAGCSAKQFWLLNRHGARYPGTEDIEQMLQVLPGLRDEVVNASGKGMLCEFEIELFKQWRPDPGMTVDHENYLVQQGYDELEGIGARYVKRFPNLFPATFSNESYYLRTSVEQRAVESGKAFAKSVFGSLDNVHFQEPAKGDPILHFYKDCKKYKSQVKNNPNASIEYDRFLTTPQFLAVQSKVQEILGLNRNITSEEILLMYKTCGFELAWNPQINSSPWCAVFDEAGFKVLEYREDLEDYWKDGYGFPITYEQACQPVVDVVDRFGAMVIGNETEATVAYFAHHGTLLKFFGRLGLFKDQKPLTSDGYEDSKDTRQWKNGRIGKFAANLVFVLLHCPSEPSPYQVATFVQEKPTPIPACENQWICPWEKFEQNLRPIVDTCDLDNICRVE